ncbi:hypothetical protein ACLKA6_014618 [Drosophila palustris]
MNQLPKLPQIVPQNGAVSKRIASNNKIDIHRLYNAYRDRVKDGGDDVKHGTGLIGGNPAVAEEEENDSLGKILKTDLGGSVAGSEKTSLIGIENSKADSKKKPQLMSSAVHCDAPTDHNVGDLKCVPKQKSKDVEEEKNGRENSDIKDPVVKGMVILKMDLPTKDRLEASNTPGKPTNSQDSQDAAERRIAELNRVYKEFISAWKKPSTDAKRPNLFVSKPVRLNALNELMNVVENLRQPNTMDDFVKAINDEMTKEREGLTSSDKLSDNMVRTNQMKIERATGIFKRMSGNDVNSGEVKTGGLYEQYKNKLNEILKAHKNPSKSFGKGISEISPCHCDAKKPLTLIVDSEGNRISSGQSQCHCDASRFALNEDSTKLSNGVVQCHCDDVKDAKLVDHKPEKASDYFEALEACMKVHKEKTVNGGPKPYYISNSKQRQMVWNEIPLMRSGQNKATKTVSKGKAKISAGSQDNRQSTVKTNSPNDNSKMLQAKHRSSTAKRSPKRGLTDSTDRNGNQLGNVGFPQVLVQQVGTGPQAGNRMIDNMAKQLNVSPMEMAQRIAASSSSSSSSSNSASTYPLQSNSASQNIGYQVPTNRNKIAPETTNVAPMLEKILSRLQTMQDTNFNRGVEMWAADRLPCCFAEPADGAPCEITGSWESLLLGVRIHIVDEHRLVKDAPKPVCAQPQSRDSSTSSSNRSWRQCAKMTPKEIKERFRAGEMKVLNITIEDTVPPRPHEMLENINDWIFTGHAISTLGGPVSFSCRKLDSKLMGTFIGFCRNCGCIDTIFGSWTFCHPSKDCQDITMSIFERRDVLRRYSLPEVRRERIKDQLYTRSKFAKLEKQQQDEHPIPHPHSG